jgi:hypothetical protein
MLLSITSGTVVFGQNFTQSITIYDPMPGTPTEGNPTPEPILVPITTIPEVSVDFVDSGVTFTSTTATVVISGKYVQILPMYWRYLDLNGVVQQQTGAPDLGTYKTITKVSTPPRTTEDATYTITAFSTVTNSTGTFTFVQTADLVTYDNIANVLKSLLQAVD